MYGVRWVEEENKKELLQLVPGGLGLYLVTRYNQEDQEIFIFLLFQRKTSQHSGTRRKLWIQRPEFIVKIGHFPLIMPSFLIWKGKWCWPHYLSHIEKKIWFTLSFRNYNLLVGKTTEIQQYLFFCSYLEYKVELVIWLVVQHPLQLWMVMW